MINKPQLRIESPPHPVKEPGSVLVRGDEEAVEHEAALLHLQPVDLHVGDIPDEVPEDAPADAVVGGDPLERRPAKRVLLVGGGAALAVGAGAGEGAAVAGLPHCGGGGEGTGVGLGE